MNFNLSKRYKNNSFGGLIIHLVLTCGIILILCVLYFYAWLPSTTNHGETITVPNVEGKPLSDVGQFLEEHDLRFEISDSVYNDDFPPLTVLKQVPAAGSKVKENRKIYISINRVTPPTVPMPDLIDGSLINAEALLKGSELKRGRIQYVKGPFPNVVRQMKIKGKVVSPKTPISKGTIIDLVVEDGGSNQFSIPDVLGMDFEEAEFTILASNFTVGRVIIVGGDTTGRNPVILQQNPVPQENMFVGDPVDLWIGEKGTSVNDPDGESTYEVDDTDSDDQ